MVAIGLQSGEVEPAAAIAGAMQMILGMSGPLKRLEERLVEIQIVGSEELKSQAEGMSAVIRTAVGGVLFSRAGPNVIPLSVEMINQVAEKSTQMTEKFLMHVRGELGVARESTGDPRTGRRPARSDRGRPQAGP
jgi:hypothetical protein